MSITRKILGGLDALFHKGAVEQELDEELRGYMETEAAEKTKAGMSREEAMRQVRMSMGSAEGVKEEVRSVGWETFAETLWQDIRYGARMLRKNPGFTAVAVLTLALGIGANTAIFSVVNAVLVKPLPYPQPKQLVNVWRTHNDWIGSVSIPDLRDWQQNTAFEGISPYSAVRFNLHGRGEPETAEGASVGANFFDVMRVPLFLGRGFLSGEDTAGAKHEVVLSYELWASQFGGDRSLVGRNIELDGESYTVVGVMPRGFHYPHALTNLWVPLVPTQDELSRRDAHDFLTVARVKPGISIGAATNRLDEISARLAKVYTQDIGLGARLVPLKAASEGRIRDSLMFVFYVVGFVFLIACANVSSFLLSRMEARRKEIAVRAALGAGRGRLVRQFFVESLLLALCGAGLAALTAKWSVEAIVALGSQYFSNPGRIRPDATVLAFTMGLAILAAALVSAGVAWSVARADVHETLKEGAQAAAGGRRRIRSQRLLVVIQIGAAFLLLICAGAMIESLAKLSRINPGFQPDHVLTMRIPLPPKKYSEQHPLFLFFQPLLAKIDALPGVAGAAVITYLPMQAWGTNTSLVFEDKPKPRQADEPWAEVRAISPDYFRVMGIRLLRGRWFTDADGANAPRVLVVNRTFATKYFPNGEAVGNRVHLGDEQDWSTIVGVVDDSRQAGLESPALPEADVPYSQNRWDYLTRTMSLVVRTKRDPLAVSKPVEQAIYAVDSDQGVYGIKTVDDVIADSEADQRFVMWLLGLFSALAVALAATGLFGQMSYAVTERTHEIGVRMALGAQRVDVFRLVIGQGVILAAIGMAIGFAGSIAFTRVIASLLSGVKPEEPVVMVGSAVLLTGVALLASYIPARRAMKVDPMVALRYE